MEAKTKLSKDGNIQFVFKKLTFQKGVCGWNKGFSRKSFIWKKDFFENPLFHPYTPFWNVNFFKKMNFRKKATEIISVGPAEEPIHPWMYIHINQMAHRFHYINKTGL